MHTCVCERGEGPGAASNCSAPTHSLASLKSPPCCPESPAPTLTASSNLAMGTYTGTHLVPPPPMPPPPPFSATLANKESILGLAEEAAALTSRPLTPCRPTPQATQPQQLIPLPPPFPTFPAALAHEASVLGLAREAAALTSRLAERRSAAAARMAAAARGGTPGDLAAAADAAVWWGVGVEERAAAAQVGLGDLPG